MDEFDGGRLALDYVNTIGWRGTGRQTDRIASYGDLVAWGERARIVSSRTAASLRRRKRRFPGGAMDALSRAHRSRETLHRIFLAVAAGEPPGRRDIAAVNRDLASSAPRRRLIRTGKGFAWAPQDMAAGIDCLLAPILWAAADLLTDGELDRVRLCASHECGWLFYDSSRNRSRRWCSMADCGNRAKAKRHYARRKSV